MTAFIIRRVLQAALVILGVSLITFLLLQVSGDPASLLLPLEASPADLERLRSTLGLNAPLHVQYLRFLSALVQGDLGTSITYRDPALELVLDRLPATLLLGLSALALAVIVALPLGIIAALNPNTWLDRLGMSLALFGQSVPIYWMGIMLILLFSVQLGWLPTGGRGGFENLILPVVTLSLYSMARTARMVRSSLLDVLSEDYVRTARAKGLLSHVIVLKHALRNASLPILTVIGLDLGNLLGGAVITETIFAWPGIGRLAVQAIYARDYPVVQATVILGALIYVFVNLIVDVFYAWLDPRVRYDS